LGYYYYIIIKGITMTAQIENEIKYVLKDPKGLIENLEIMMENKECKIL
jgi:hypothetical protein